MSEARLAVLLKPLPIGGDVAGVADGDKEVVGSVAQGVDDLKGGALLPLDPVGIDRVDQRDRVLLGQRRAPD